MSATSVHSIEDWIGILKPLGYWDGADVILDDLDDYPKKGGELRKLLNAHREEDKQQLGNALIAWAMLTAIEIEAQLGWRAPQQAPTRETLIELSDWGVTLPERLS